MTTRQWIGLLFIVIGTVLLMMDAPYQPPPQKAEARPKPNVDFETFRQARKEA